MNAPTSSIPNSPKRRLPTGLKLAIGCIAVAFGLATVAAVVLGVGGFWLKGKADDVIEGVQARADAQKQAADILDRLRRGHPFTQPGDGRIDPGSADRFFRATDLAWEPIESAVRRLMETADRTREDRPRLSDVFDGVRATSLLVDSRLHIARALDEVGLSLEEFVWTGGALRNAWRDANAPAAYRGSREAGDPVTLANIALAERHGERLAERETSADEANPSTVLDLAMVWFRAVPRAPAQFP